MPQTLLTEQQARPSVILHCSNTTPPPSAQGSHTPADQAVEAVQSRSSNGRRQHQSRPTPRPPTWAEIAARRPTAPPSIPVWRPGFAPTFSSTEPHSSALPSPWSAGSVPLVLPSAQPPRPHPTRRQHPSSRPRTSHPRSRPAAASRQRQPPSTPLSPPTQELLIDLNC